MLKGALRTVRNCLVWKGSNFKIIYFSRVLVLGFSMKKHCIVFSELTALFNESNWNGKSELK
jgi:hypothetical protein